MGAEKIAKLGIKRDNDLMYYIKNGDVWATPRKKPGQPKGKASKVAAAGVRRTIGHDGMTAATFGNEADTFVELYACFHWDDRAV